MMGRKALPQWQDPLLLPSARGLLVLPSFLPLAGFVCLFFRRCRHCIFFLVAASDVDFPSRLTMRSSRSKNRPLPCDKKKSEQPPTAPKSHSHLFARLRLAHAVAFKEGRGPGRVSRGRGQRKAPEVPRRRGQRNAGERDYLRPTPATSAARSGDGGAGDSVPCRGSLRGRAAPSVQSPLFRLLMRHSTCASSPICRTKPLP